jgi:hypothetical protein
MIRRLFPTGANLPVDPISLALIHELDFDDNEKMIKQKHLQRITLGIRPQPRPSRQPTLENQLSPLLCQLEIEIWFARPHTQLLIQVHEIKLVLRPSTLDIDLGQKLLHLGNRLRQTPFIRIIILRVVVYRAQKQGVPRQPRRRLGQVPIQFQFPRLDLALYIVDEACKCRICRALLFKFVLSPELVCAVADKRLEFGDPFEEDVAYLFDYGGGLLAAGESFGEAGVYAVDFEDVAKNGADEFLAARSRDNIALTQRDDPELQSEERFRGVEVHHVDTRYP